MNTRRMKAALLSLALLLSVAPSPHAQSYCLRWVQRTDVGSCAWLFRELQTRLGMAGESSKRGTNGPPLLLMQSQMHRGQ